MRNVVNVIYLNFVRVVCKVPRRKFCTNMSTKSAILLIADGSEEMEAVITADILRRAKVYFVKQFLN